MAITNFTDDGNQKTFEEQFCSPEFTRGIHNPGLICLSVLNIFLSITAFLGNFLILVALHKESSLHPPSKLLFRCLATTDLCVGLIVEPLIVTYWISLVNERWNICKNASAAVFIAGYILTGVSLLTVTAVSVDRLLALLLGLRYRQVVTLKRTYVILITFWFASIVGGTMYFFNYLITIYIGYIGISVCFVILILSYTKFFVTIRQHHRQVQDQVHQGQPSQAILLARCRKAMFSALWLQMTLLACYLPYCIMAAFGHATVASQPNIFFAHQMGVTLLLLNSSLNPIVYCWRIREVRQAVKDTIKQLCCSSC